MSFNLTISHRGQSHTISLPLDSTFGDLQQHLESLTSVPASYQKLLYKGKKNVGADGLLVDAGMKDGTKVTLLGSTPSEIGDMRAVEDEKKRREGIMRERAKKGPTKLRSTASPSTLASSLSSTKYKFHKIQPLPHLPNPPAATDLLSRLASDPAILHVMQQHQYEVGVLTELAPHEHPHLLGLNENAGQAIKLRLRTNDYEGFRLYRDIRMVLCHELAHNVHSDHDNNFKELNSRLNREVAAFERAARDGAHTLTVSGDVYEPGLEVEAQDALITGSFLLGGTSNVSAPDSREERRRRMLEATMDRLRKQEEVVEHSCGTAGPKDGNPSGAVGTAPEKSALGDSNL